jgi:hypothetical protein
MKKLFLLLLVAIMLTACGPKPRDLVNSWQAALNKGDIDAALSYLADDATVTIAPPADGDGVYTGHAEIRGWYETIVSGKGKGTLTNCKADGETITCTSTYADEGLKAMGVDFIEGTWVAFIRDGRIQSYTFTITPESLAKFPPPPTEPPAPTPTEPPIVVAPTAIPAPEVRITTAEPIIGKWEGKYDGQFIHHHFQVNGGYVVKFADSSMNISVSQYWFEDDLLKFQDATGDCAGIAGSYEVYATYEGDKIVKLRFVLVGTDACVDRKKSFAGKTLINITP